MQEELYKRIKILEVNGVICGRAAALARNAVDLILSEYQDISQDKLEMLITHLAMAGQRAIDGIEEVPLDEAALESIQEESVYEEAVDLRTRILSGSDISFPETELDYLSLHLCNLLYRKKEERNDEKSGGR